MTQLKTLFIGIGSIGKRHIRNLRLVCAQRGISLTVDALRRPDSKPLTDADLKIDTIYTDMQTLPKDYDVIFVTNPTENHLQTMREIQAYGKHFFIEKPISSIHQIPDMEALPLKPDAVYYVACPLRYCAVLQYIAQHLPEWDVISARCISSSYLPDWRPNIDYRENYSAHKDQGGGVDIDLIHEWDYITFLFGMPETVKSLIGRKSKLEIDSNDYALYLAEYPDKVVELHLDYFGRKTLREVMLFTAEDTIVGDIEGNVIRFLKSGEVLQLQEEQDDYQKELCHFLDMIDGRVKQDNNIQKAIKTLKLTQGEL